MVIVFIDAFNLPEMASQKKRVCVIGAGVSGVVAAVHLKAAALDVTVFERSSVAGGVWCVVACRPIGPYCTDLIILY
jgi:MFS transporter, ACS family, pantothenate transporter